MDMHYLDKLFNPNSIALIRATGKPAAVGFQVFNNLLQGGFSGEIYLINPKHRSIQGRPCYASVNAVSKPTEMLALVANLGFYIRPDENDHTLQIATKLFI